MTVSPTPLKDLSKKEQLFGGKFLKAILESNRSEIGNLDDDKLNIIATLIQAFEPVGMKTLITNALTEETKTALLPFLSDQDCALFFETQSNIDVLPTRFKTQSSERQRLILDHLFKTDRDRFTKLKPEASAPAAYVSGIRIEDNSPSEKESQAEAEALLDAISNATLSITEVTKTMAKHQASYSASDQEKLCLKIIHGFKRLNLEISNPQSFTCYLKLFNVIESSLPLFPILETALTSILDKVLTTTAKLTDINWQLTILGQLPEQCLLLTIRRLKQFDAIREFEKRNLYGKLKGTLEQQLHNPKAAPILAAWEEA